MDVNEVTYQIRGAVFEVKLKDLLFSHRPTQTGRDRGRKSEVRGRKTEDGDRRSENRDRRSEDKKSHRFAKKRDLGVLDTDFTTL